jgi:hypothetical protein
MNSSSNSVPIVHASVVEDPIKQIQIPLNVRPGDSFVYHDPHTGPFTVIVPSNASPGSFINVVVPSSVEMLDAEDDSAAGCSRSVTLDRATIGATVAAGVVGTIVFGTIGGIVLAGGAAYLATAKKDSPMGQSVRKAGDMAVKGTAKAKHWLARQLRSSTSSRSSPRVQGVATQSPTTASK